MNCKKTLVAALATVGLTATFSSINSTEVQARSYQSAYTTKNSIVYKNSKGLMRIYEVKGFCV